MLHGQDPFLPQSTHSNCENTMFLPLTDKSPRELPDSPVRLLEDEEYPSLENSPREAIVIDRSFQHTPINRNSKQQFKLLCNKFRISYEKVFKYVARI